MRLGCKALCNLLYMTRALGCVEDERISATVYVAEARPVILVRRLDTLIVAVFGRGCVRVSLVGNRSQGGLSPTRHRF